MKKFVILLTSLVCCTAATWQDRIDHHYGKPISPLMYQILGEGESAVITLWDLPFQQPAIAQLLGHDAEIDASPDYSEGRKREAASKLVIQAQCESNLVSLAASHGFTNSPLDWLALYQYGLAVTETNKTAGMELRLQVLELLLFVDRNGGDVRKIGKGKK